MTRQHLGIGIIAFTTLLLELGLIRAFDVILDPTLGYMIVTIAMFALGLGGIYVYIFKAERFRPTVALPLLTLLYACSALLILPILNILPFDRSFSGPFWEELGSWAGMYLTIFTPFFLSGIILSIIFSVESAKINSLYFADLAGAGLACLLLMLLIPAFGPGGMLFLIAGLLCIAAFCFSSLSGKMLRLVVPTALALAAAPFIHDGYVEFEDHANKRGTDDMRDQGRREYVKWDPVSKLEVFGFDAGKYFSLDGGKQNSWMTPFNGDFAAPKEEVRRYPDACYFGARSLAYYLKRNTQTEALILGAAVGGEPRAALIFGAREVDAIEMVGAMVRAAKGRYAEYSGNLFNHPQVRYQTGEARTFLRATDKKYDIIQMFSNHNSSSIAQGNGALEAVYLQTVEAYEEYFGHLKPDGILFMNRHFYPRMLTTAALAWHRMGRSDFYRHVLVLERAVPDNQPAVLVKMTPWTAEEVAEAVGYLNREIISWDTDQGDKLSAPIVSNRPYEGAFLCGEHRLERLALLFSTDGREGPPYRVRVRFTVAETGRTAEFSLDGRQIRDDEPVVLPLESPWDNLRGRRIHVTVVAENDQPDQAVSLRLNKYNQPIIPGVRTGAGMLPSRIVFNPLEPEKNLLPQALLEQPFPKELAAQADYRLEPASDDRPFFNMVRKTTKKLDPAASRFLDGNTAAVLNSQLLPFLSKDVLGIFVVGGMSLAFAAVFVFAPLRLTRKGEGRGPAMPWFLLYFSCLGAGFIIIELTLIQLCTKVIGHPAHTYAAVLFALLLSAALGSLCSKRLPAALWPLIFAALVAYGLFFLTKHQAIFTWLLQFGLPSRWIAATLLIFPLGFFLGMPFPLGIGALGRVWPAGIAWAWGMNGFFTVVGGFLSMISAFFLGFRATLLIALGIYCLALAAFAVISRRCRRIEHAAL